jgi:hypothetical protein
LPFSISNQYVLMLHSNRTAHTSTPHSSNATLSYASLSDAGLG